MKAALTASIATTLALAHKSTLKITDPAGLEITCTQGALWLTLDGELRDVILTAGTTEASFTTQHHRSALLYALADAQVSVAARSAQTAKTQRAVIHAPFAGCDARALLPMALAR